MLKDVLIIIFSIILEKLCVQALQEPLIDNPMTDYQVKKNYQIKLEKKRDLIGQVEAVELSKDDTDNWSVLEHQLRPSPV